MEYLHIANWNRWQTYRKDRGQPPWIKIYRRLLRNPEWVSLTDAERGQLVVMWLLAADHDGVIPASLKVIQKLCFMSQPPNINKFIELGFIKDGGCQGGVKVASDGRQHDRPKAETDTDTKADTKAEQTIEHLFESFWKIYPKKKNKGHAEKAWKKIKPKPNNKFLLKLQSCIEKAVKSDDWVKDFGKYIPYPATWLNAKGWEDEYYVSPLRGLVSEKTVKSMENMQSWMEEDGEKQNKIK